MINVCCVDFFALNQSCLSRYKHINVISMTVVLIRATSQIYANLHHMAFVLRDLERFMLKYVFESLII